MIWLILCILLTTSFFIIFKLYHLFKINTFQAIVFNYITCVCVGLVFSYDLDFNKFTSDLSWMPYGFALGFLFISTFFLMARTAQEVSVAVSTVASKISMLIPSTVAIILYLDVRQEFSWINGIGFFLAIMSLFLITKKEKVENLHVSGNQIILVLAVFVGTGMVDTVLNIAGKNFGSELFNKGFPIFCFSIAAIGGVLVSIFVKKDRFEWKNLIGGIALGVPNYFSIYTLMQGLDYYHGNAAYVYPIVHICSILFSSFAAFLFFKEKLSKLNYLGVLVAIFAVILLSLKFDLYLK